MERTIEINCHCTECGIRLDTEFTMDKKAYNVARIDVTPCKTCESVRTGKPLSQSVEASISSIAASKKRGRPPLKKSGTSLTPLAHSHKKRGRPSKADLAARAAGMEYTEEL